MSSKVERKSLDLFVVVVCGLFISFFIAIHSLTPINQIARFEFVESVSENALYYRNYHLRLNAIRISHKVAKMYMEKLQEIEAQEPELTEAQIIDGYIYLIVDERYPELDPELIRAIVYHESRYRPQVVNSSSGTTGLMQLSPKWHTARAQKLGVDDLKDPYGNILTGCDLLDELFNKYPRNYALDYYAGGGEYAKSYKGSISPFVAQLTDIMRGLRNGTIVPGGD